MNKTYIEDLNISLRCLNALRSSNILFLEQLCDYKRKSISLRDIGNKSIKELDVVLKAYNLSWKDGLPKEKPIPKMIIDDNFLTMIFRAARHKKIKNFKEYFKEEIKHYKL